MYVRRKRRHFDSPSCHQKGCVSPTPTHSTFILSTRAPLRVGHTKIPDTATFPNGLPETQTYPETASSKSDNGGMQLDDIFFFFWKADKILGCISKRKWSGSCCMARKNAHRRSRSRSASRTRPTKAVSSTDKLTEPGTQSSGRPAELRPVLPRSSRPLHNLTSDFTQYHPRHHSQESLLLGQAHNIAHPYNIFRNRSVPNMVMRHDASMPVPAVLSEERRFHTQYPSVCGCGDTCSCLRCPQHDNTGPSSTGGSNPCPDCTILSLAADTPSSIFDAYPAASIDEWTMQIPSVPRESSAITLQQQQDVWDNYLAPITEPPSNNEGKYSIQPCCGVLCKCSPETCECDIEREEGYDCRKESLILDSISMLSVSDEHVVATGPFDGIMTSQPVGAIDSGPGSWDIQNYPRFPAASARSRSLSLSLSSSSSRSNYQLSSDFDFFNPTDDFASQPLPS